MCLVVFLWKLRFNPRDTSLLASVARDSPGRTLATARKLFTVKANLTKFIKYKFISTSCVREPPMY